MRAGPEPRGSTDGWHPETRHRGAWPRTDDAGVWAPAGLSRSTPKRLQPLESLARALLRPWRLDRPAQLNGNQVQFVYTAIQMLELAAPKGAAGSDLLSIGENMFPGAPAAEPQPIDAKSGGPGLI